MSWKDWLWSLGVLGVLLTGGYGFLWFLIVNFDCLRWCGR